LNLNRCRLTERGVWGNFASLKDRKDLKSYESLEDYYKEVLRFSRVSKEGILESLNSENFNDMMKLTEKREDLEMLFEAFYNFKGHRV
jgi:hypothetical protein